MSRGFEVYHRPGGRGDRLSLEFAPGLFCRIGFDGNEGAWLASLNQIADALEIGAKVSYQSRNGRHQLLLRPNHDCLPARRPCRTALHCRNDLLAQRASPDLFCARRNGPRRPLSRCRASQCDSSRGVQPAWLPRLWERNLLGAIRYGEDPGSTPIGECDRRPAVIQRAGCLAS